MEIYQASVLHYCDPTVMRSQDVWDALWAKVETATPCFRELQSAKDYCERDGQVFVATWIAENSDDAHNSTKKVTAPVVWRQLKNGTWSGRLKRYSREEWHAIITQTTLR